MDNNEFNPSKVTNELNTPVGEYTAAQKAEFSFKADNVNPLKDELNDTSTVNDKVEDNLSKKAKQEEEKKKEQNDNTSDSGNISSTSAASSSAAASSGGIVATVAAAATVAVTAVGGLVGLNLVEDESKHEDLITFVSSEITADSIDVSFSMLSSYLRYEEDPTGAGSDEPLPEKTVVYTIKDGYGFIDEQMVEGGLEIDDQHTLYDLHIGELTPDTGYNLTLNIKYEYPDREIPYYKELATRNFQTQAIPTSGDLVEFLGLEASSTGVSFEFKVGKDTVNYDPQSQTPPAILMTINGPNSYYDEQYVREVSEYDETSIFASGSFSGLRASSEYTITIKFNTETEVITLGSTTFTTQQAPSSGFGFYQITPDAKFVNVIFYVNSTYVGEEPTLIVRAVKNGTVESSAEASLWNTSGTRAFYEAKVENLTPETGYELNVYWEKQDQSIEYLGSDVATTTEYSNGFRFESSQCRAGHDYINYGFYIKKEEVTYSDQTSNIDVILEGGDYSQTFNILDFTVSDEKTYYYSTTIENLDANVEFTLTVKNNLTLEEYGSMNFATNGLFSFVEVIPGATTASISFAILSDYVGYEEGNFDKIYVSATQLPDFIVTTEDDVSYTVDGDYLIGTVTFDNLVSGKEYEVQVVYNSGSDILGETTFNTTSAGPTVNGVSSDYQGSLDSHTGIFIMPVAIDFTGTSSEDSFTLEISPTLAPEHKYTATVDARTTYQYARFTDANTIINFVDSEFTVKVYDGNDTSGDVLYDTTDTISLVSIDKVYIAVLDYNTELSSSDTTLDFSMVYLYGDDSHPITFCIIDGNNDRHQFTPSIPLTPTDEVLSCNLVSDSGGSFSSYEGLKQAFEGQQLTILISYFDSQTGSEDVIMAEGITLTFA